MTLEKGFAPHPGVDIDMEIFTKVGQVLTLEFRTPPFPMQPKFKPLLLPMEERLELQQSSDNISETTPAENAIDAVARKQ